MALRTDRSFGWSDISRVQLKPNWAVSDGIVACDLEATFKQKLTLFQEQWKFLECLV